MHTKINHYAIIYTVHTALVTWREKAEGVMGECLGVWHDTEPSFGHWNCGIQARHIVRIHTCTHQFP